MKHLALLLPLVASLGCATFSADKAVAGVDKALAVVDVAMDKAADAHAAGADIVIEVCKDQPVSCYEKLGYSPEDAEAFAKAMEAASKIYDELVDLKQRMQAVLPGVVEAVKSADKARKAAQ